MNKLVTSVRMHPGSGYLVDTGHEGRAHSMLNIFAPVWMLYTGWLYNQENHWRGVAWRTAKSPWKEGDGTAATAQSRLLGWQRELQKRVYAGMAPPTRQTIPTGPAPIWPLPWNPTLFISFSACQSLTLWRSILSNFCKFFPIYKVLTCFHSFFRECL
jgi:hypothetical protein